MASLDAIQTIARSLQATANPTISGVVVLAVNIVESAQHIGKDEDKCYQLAMDAWSLVLVVAWNNQQHTGTVGDSQFDELVKVLEDIKSTFTDDNGGRYSDVDIGRLRQSLIQWPQQLHLGSFTDIQQKANDLARMWSSVSLSSGIDQSVTVDDNANFSQSQGNAIGFNNTVSNTFVTNSGLNATNIGSNNINANVQGSNNDVHIGNDFRGNYGVINITHQTDNGKRDEILNRLRRAPAQYSSSSGSGGCMPGTRTFVLDGVMKWVGSRNPDDPLIFWLYGPAGTGKSAIAYSVAERCSQLNNCLTASFFFTYTNAYCSDANLFFSTIAYQLANLNPGLKELITDRIQKHANPEAIRPEVQLADLVIRPLSELQNRTPVVIVVDALDECSDADGASETLQLLAAKITKLPFPLKLFITSRPEPHIKAMMESELRPVTHSLNISQDVGLSSTNIDIRHFFSSRLHEGTSGKFGNTTPWLEEKDIDALVHQSGGLFIYASTAVKVILDNKFKNPRAQLEKLLHTQVMPGLDAVNALYLRILQNALPEDADETLKQEFQLILGTIIVAKEALSPRTLEALLGLRAGSTRRILSSLQSVIAIPDSDDSEIHVFHPSFPRYLTSQQSFSGTDVRFSIDPIKYHTHVAQCSFNHMKFSLRKNICCFDDFSSMEMRMDNEHHSKNIAQEIPDVVKYACRHFATHVHATDINVGSLGEMLADWVHHRLLYWLEVLALLDSLGTALPSLTLLSRWLEMRNNNKKPLVAKVTKFLPASMRPDSKQNAKPTSSADREVKSLLKGAIRMVSDSFDLIRHVPSQVYTSCIFMPTNSPFYKTYSAQCSDIRFIHGSHNNWSPITVLHTFYHSALGLAFSSNGRVLASSHEDNSVRLLNLDTGECKVINWEGKGTSEGVENSSFIAFSPDDKYIAAGHVVYDVETGQQILGHADCLAFSPDGNYVALSSEDGSIKFYDSQRHALVSQLSGHAGSITSMAFSPDSKWLASAARDNTLRIWRVDKPGQTLCLQRQESMKHPHTVAFSPNSAYIAFCDNDQVRIWFMTEGREISSSRQWERIKEFRRPVFSHDSKSVTWVTDDGNITVTRLEGVQGKPDRFKWRGFSSLAFPPGGKTIAAGDAGGKIFILGWGMWNMLRFPAAVHGVNEDVIGIIPAPNGACFASWTKRYDKSEGSICVWELDEEELGLGLIFEDVVSVNNVKSAVFAPDGKTVAAIKKDWICKVDALSGQETYGFMSSGVPHSIEFSSDSRYLVTYFESHADLWQWEPFRRFKPKPVPHTGQIQGCALSLDAEYAALCYEEKKLFVVSLKQHNVLIPFDNAEAISPRTLQFSPDGRHVLATTLDVRQIIVWKATTGEQSARILLSGDLNEVSFSPDGRHIAYQTNNEIYLWDFLDGTSQGRIAYRGLVDRFSLSPLNSKHIATLSRGPDGRGRITLIDIDSQEKVAETTAFSSYRAFMRAFRRNGLFPDYPLYNGQAAVNEDKCNFPWTLDEKGYVRTATSRPLCHLPVFLKPRHDLLKWGGIFDTNGNRIVIVTAIQNVVLIQCGAEPIFKDLSPLRIGIDADAQQVMPYYY